MKEENRVEKNGNAIEILQKKENKNRPLGDDLCGAYPALLATSEPHK